LAYWQEAIFQQRPGGNWWMILQHDGGEECGCPEEDFDQPTEMEEG
jgi:hypothetical protein